MSFGSDIGKEFDKVKEARLDHTLRSAVVNLYSDLVESSPVDSGELKASWQPPKEVGKRRYVIRNIAPHAYVIDGGRRPVQIRGNEVMVGSDQLPKGFSPIVEITEKALQRKFNK